MATVICEWAGVTNDCPLFVGEGYLINYYNCQLHESHPQLLNWLFTHIFVNPLLSESDDISWS
mgnify:CR=1 FL=1